MWSGLCKSIVSFVVSTYIEGENWFITVRLIKDEKYLTKCFTLQ